MNYLVISDELIVNGLAPELRKVYDRYVDSLKQRTTFQELQSKLLSNRMSKAWYNEECARLASKVKYMSFRSDKGERGVFVVRPTISKKRIHLGQSASFDEACGFISEYLTAVLEISVN